MSLAWSEVLPALLVAVETWSGRPSLERICVVRDLQGRIRLAVKPVPGAVFEAMELEARITEALGLWFASPLLWTGEPSRLEERRLAGNLVERLKGKWPPGWPVAWNGLAERGQIVVRADEGWCGELRVRSKEEWVQAGFVSPPWPLHPRTPAIVSFYSFKGGVGRTTTLGIVARQLARAGHDVVAMDLDLEAPGLGRFFDVSTQFGVLDLLVEHAATGRVEFGEAGAYTAVIAEGRGTITVLPVGGMDASYVERLACLDYAARARGEGSAVEAGLKAILQVVRARLKPSIILIDARAGLHDLGGLSLHALAHVDCLVGRAGRATLDGFALVLAALARRRRDEDLRVVMVQSFVPLPVDGEEYVRVRDGWALSLHEVFASTIYERMYLAKEEDLPAVRDATAIHHPWVVPHYESVARVDRIGDIDASILDARPYMQLSARIAEHCLRPREGVEEEESDGEEGAG